jgi:threonyl-tRNA synthetase
MALLGGARKPQAHLDNLEKRKANDHRKLGKDLGLFFISDYGPGFPFFLPNGMILKNSLLDYWHKIHREHGYLEVETPTILSRELWETSGHWEHYKENMYTTKIDGKDFAIKPMNCPGAILVYKNDIHSYKDLPFATPNSATSIGTKPRAPSMVSSGSAPSPKTMPTS